MSSDYAHRIQQAADTLLGLLVDEGPTSSIDARDHLASLGIRDEDTSTAVCYLLTTRRITADFDFVLRAAQDLHPCGHLGTDPGCGGCDPGAIDFVITDTGTRRPFDPALDLAGGGR